MKRKVLTALLLGVCVMAAGCSQKAETEKTETSAATEAATEVAKETMEAAGETGADGESEGASDTTASTEGADQAEVTEEPEYNALDYVTLGQYTDLEVTVSSLDVTEEDLAQQLYNDCSANDKLLKVTTGTVADGDVTNIDYVGSVDGVEFDGGTDKGVELTIGSGKFIPGFEEGLIGAAIGKETNINVTFPENYGATDLAGKDAVFAVTVNYVSKTPELTDELAAEISEYKTAEEYRKAMEDQIRTDKESQQESEKLNGILNLLYSGSTINGYPEEVVNYRTKQMKDYYMQIAAQAGVEFSDFLSQQLGMTEEDFDEQCPNVIKSSMIQELLLKAVAESENMEISEEDYEAGLNRYVENTGAESKETLLSQYSEKEIRRSILLDKALDFLKETTVVRTEDETENEPETPAASEAASEATSESESESQ